MKETIGVLIHLKLAYLKSEHLIYEHNMKFSKKIFNKIAAQSAPVEQ